MCGIVGFYTPYLSRAKISLELFERMTDSMVHRGPDAKGIVFNNNWAMGHRRLKIIDLSDNANQPMYNESGRICLVFNGEIYNYLDLKAELIKYGYKFQTSSDTEVVLRSYEKWGKECFSKFNGMFAIAIYDEDKKRLLLVTDRVGKKPIYYIEKDGQLYFASELKALFHLPHIERKISNNAVYLYLLFNYIPEPETIIQDIRKLKASNMLLYSKKGIRIEPYWNLLQICRKSGKSRKLTYEEYKERLNLLIDDAVRIRLNSDVPLGLFLSGGIDSSLVAAFAAKHKEKIKTFNVVFEGDKNLLSDASRKVAYYLGTDHKELFVSPKNFYDFFNEIPKFFDEPFSDDSLIPSYFI
jgi:asparagine synthase (glutamine-hydrolysing)